MKGLHRRSTRALATIVFAAVLATVAVTAAFAASTANWSSHGNGITNWRYQPNEKTLSTNTVGGLQPAWVDTLAGDISATPAVVDGVVYVPDWGGKISAIDASTGATIWQTDVAAASGQSGTVVSRTSPAVSGNSVVIGTQKGGRLVSLDRKTGVANWSTELDAIDHHPMAIVTQSPTIYNGVVYAGVASLEENGVDCDASLNACHFRGSESAVKLKTGAILWTTYTLSKAKQLEGYSGVAVWGSSPVVDTKRNSLYITTGNNYSAPPDVKQCALDAGDDQAALAACEPQGNGNYVDAMISLDLSTGAIKWTNKVQGYDAWTTACLGFPTACPVPNGPDFDFGQGAMLVPAKKGDLVVAGQKSGIMWALNADTGAKVWSTLAGPGSSLGGMEWGSATDGTNVYFTIANLNGITYNMVNPPAGTPATSSAGSWGAIDAATGAIKWQVADPNGAIDIGPPSVANGVVYVGSMAAPASFSPFPPFPDFSGPSMYALDSGNGKQLWSYAAGGSVNAGPAIANGMVFWGSGYSNLGPGLGGFNAKLFAFKLP